MPSQTNKHLRRNQKSSPKRAALFGSLRMTQDGLSRIGTLFFLFVWLVVLSTAFAQRQRIADWFALRNYTPPAAISSLAQQDTMTPQATRVYYVNHPELDPKGQFSKNCPQNGGEQTIVLGCYHGNQAGIFLLDVTDNRLNGVEQVTAAHEMLHAEYDRLSSNEKQRVNAMLQDYYQHKLTDVRIKKTIDAYKKTEPTELVNEMHSIFGTEVAQLPAPLETYYQRYFTNRAAVTGYAAAYQSEFTSRQAKITADDARLAELKKQIDADNAALDSQAATIDNRRQQLLALRSSNPSAYNAAVPGFNALIDQYNRLLATTKQLVSTYNQIVSERNALAFEEQQLVQALSTDSTPIKQ